MKSKFLLLVSLVLSVNVFAQTSCPDIESRRIEDVSTPGNCMVYLETVASNSTGADKAIKITIYSGTGPTRTFINTKCYILTTTGNTTLASDPFACTSIISIVTESSTSSSGGCLGGTICATTTTFFGGSPGGTQPVQLTSFDAIGKNGLVSLKWTSESEIDFKGYQIEMNDGTGFKTIGTVLAKNNGQANSYSFEYNSVSKQSVQFRLKLIDIDGKFTYSKTSLVKGDGQGFDFNIYPNPSTSANTNILVSGISNTGRIQIIDMAGKVLKTLVVNSNNVKVGYLPTGVYMVKVSNTATAEQVTKRLVIVN